MPTLPVTSITERGETGLSEFCFLQTNEHSLLSLSRAKNFVKVLLNGVDVIPEHQYRFPPGARMPGLTDPFSAETAPRCLTSLRLLRQLSRCLGTAPLPQFFPARQGGGLPGKAGANLDRQTIPKHRQGAVFALVVVGVGLVPCLVEL